MTEPMTTQCEGLLPEAQFLLDRLAELELTDDMPKDFLRDWMGHVEPAIARLKLALRPHPVPSQVENLRYGIFLAGVRAHQPFAAFEHENAANEYAAGIIGNCEVRPLATPPRAEAQTARERERWATLFDAFADGRESHEQVVSRMHPGVNYVLTVGGCRDLATLLRTAVPGVSEDPKCVKCGDTSPVCRQLGIHDDCPRKARAQRLQERGRE